MPVRTAPADRHGLAAFLAVHNDRFVEDRPGQQLPADFVGKGGYIPAVANRV
jgi:hypothetical protein